MKLRWPLAGRIALTILCGAPPSHAQLPPGLYFGQTPPGELPEVFAPGIISLDTRYEYGIVFSPDLTECSFGVTNNLWSLFRIRYTTMAPDSSWSDPVRAPYLGPAGTGDGLSPSFTADGQKVFFASTRPAYPPGNLWQSERDGMGGWTTPVMLATPISTADDEWSPCVTASGKLYFVSLRPGGFGAADIYTSVPVGGVYTIAGNAGPPLSTSNLDSTPFVAPDESYILIESDRPGGYGMHDLYISFRFGGTWTDPVNLGPGINTGQIEDEPYVTPDDKYLFFNRREAFVTNQQTDLYWVDWPSVIDATSVDDPRTDAPRGTTLRNFPNPFRPSTTIRYALETAGHVRLELFDVAGRSLGTLVDRHQEAGERSVTLPEAWTGRLPAGPVFARLSVGGRRVSVRRMILLR